MKARTRRNALPGSRLGLLGILMVLGLGCGSSAPAAQEPAPEPEPGAASEPVQEPASEPAPGTAADSADAAETAPAAGPEQASAQPAAPEQAEERVEPAPEPSGKVLQLIQESEEAARVGMYGQARRLCSQALEIEPAQPRAVVVCAVAACNLNNRRLAKRYYAMAPTQEYKNMIYQVCRSKGIDAHE